MNPDDHREDFDVLADLIAVVAAHTLSHHWLLRLQGRCSALRVPGCSRDG